MSTPHDIDGFTEAPADKFELHYRQQLSALVDGELATDQARFLLRRLEHDAELSACQERWQLLGDVLRGHACAPAPAGFAQGVQAAIAADVARHGPSPVVPQYAARRGWKRWGGGVALAASVAAVALFMAREQLPETVPAVPQTVIATTAQLPAPAGMPGIGDAEAGLAAVAAAPVVAAVAVRRAEAKRGSATRTRQMARGTAVRLAEPERAVAAAQAPEVPLLPQNRNPFASAAGTLQARPWPRSPLSPLSQGSLNASFPAQERGTTFYPFEPRPQMLQALPAEHEPQLPQH
ncbi:Regulatory protein [uncultured Stenotrophomonas sp.]|uniref:Regulatory protein n=1 Tax=uncultured Stenotrophomonas sp. TaxID=165438 RepID=A0A1Y5Q670_9GAMM|nr:Regulatory protein [uncultured Stenotrophomonas sp.]